MSGMNKDIAKVLASLDREKRLLDQKLSKLPEAHQKIVVPLMGDINKLNRSIQSMDLDAINETVNSIKSKNYEQNANFSK